VRRPVSSSISPSVRDALAVIHQQTLELIVRGASLDAVLDALCDGIDALDPDLISTVLVADHDGQRLWPKAGRRAPEAWKQFITPLPIGPCRGRAARRRSEKSVSSLRTSPPTRCGPKSTERWRCGMVSKAHGQCRCCRKTKNWSARSPCTRRRRRPLARTISSCSRRPATLPHRDRARPCADDTHARARRSPEVRDGTPDDRRHDSAADRRPRA
jgi:hypothetical protein